MRRALAIAALLFFVAGVVGLVFTSKLSEWGSVYSIQGDITFGTFVAVGLAVLVTLLCSS